MKKKKSANPKPKPRSTAKPRLKPKRAPKPIPFDYVLEELEPVSPFTKPMFGCTAVYVDDKIMLILRDRPTATRDNGVWLIITPENHASLRKEFPSMRPLEMIGPRSAGWMILPDDADDFEESVLRACELIRRRDPRIGKVPKPRKRPSPT